MTPSDTTTDCDQNGQSLLTGISSYDTSVVRRELRKLHARWLTRNVALRSASCWRTRSAPQYRLDSTALIWQRSKKHWCRRTGWTASWSRPHTMDWLWLGTIVVSAPGKPILGLDPKGFSRELASLSDRLTVLPNQQNSRYVHENMRKSR